MNEWLNRMKKSIYEIWIFIIKLMILVYYYWWSYIYFIGLCHIHACICAENDKYHVEMDVIQWTWYGFLYPMMTSSNGNIFRVTGPLCGEFTGPGEFPTQRPVTRSFDVFFDLRRNEWLSKQPWGWWFETPSLSLSRQCNALRTDSHVNRNVLFVFHDAITPHQLMSGILNLDLKCMLLNHLLH